MAAGLANSQIGRILRQCDLIQAMDQHFKTISVRVTSRHETVGLQVEELGSVTGLWRGSRDIAMALSYSLIIDAAPAAANVAMDQEQHLLKEFRDRLIELHWQLLTRTDGSTYHPRWPADE